MVYAGVEGGAGKRFALLTRDGFEKERLRCLFFSCLNISGKMEDVQSHPLFKDIVMHSDEELARLFGAEIVERETIHEWPLSCVQRVLLDDHRKLIYKSQLPPTVEREFYENAVSSLLPGHRVLERLGECDIMTIDWIDTPLLRDAVSSEVDLVEHGRRLVSEIGKMRGELPTYLDIGTPEAWLATIDVDLEKLKLLILRNRFRLMEASAIEPVRQWSTSTQVIDTLTDHPRVIHGDLTDEQVFVTDRGYQVIDWQRPVVAPPEVDLVSLLIGRRINPRRHVDPAIVKIFWFLRLHWAIEAQFDMFPEFDGALFDQWSSKAIRRILG